MLKQRIIATLRFFALQSLPLTLFELHKYLLNDLEAIKQQLGQDWEVEDQVYDRIPKQISIAEVQQCLEQECAKEVKVFRGFYYLADKSDEFVTQRSHNYLYGVLRERIIKKHTWGLRWLPFLRSVSLVGSQALGLHRKTSDIDLLMIVEPRFMWLARFFLTAYFHFLGVRRHGKKIANRVCLNHYIASPKSLTLDRNIYTATEYHKARPIYHAGVLNDFKQNNLDWLRVFFPNIKLWPNKKIAPSILKRGLEKLLNNQIGQKLEQLLGAYQLQRINRSEFVVVAEDELSFHPDNRKAQLFTAFFQD